MWDFSPMDAAIEETLFCTLMGLFAMTAVYFIIEIFRATHHKKS